MAQGASVVEAVAKYFFLSCLDEQLSFTASLKALAELKSANWIEPEHRSRWVHVLRRWHPKVAHLRPRPWADLPLQKGFHLPGQLEMTAWAAFIANADASEVEAVLLSQILSFTDDEIAAGLGVTAGTVRYRVGRGLRHLGGFIEPAI